MNIKGWKHESIGELCEFSNGHGFGPKDWSETGLPIIRIQNLNGSGDFNYFKDEPEDAWLVEPGTLLFAWAGTRGVSFGPKVWNGPQGVLNQHIYRVHPNKGVDSRWLYLALLRVTERIERKAHGFKSTLLHVGKDDITEQTMPVPPLPEQRKIADIVGTWDEALEKLDALIAAKDRRKQALMQQLLTGKRRLSAYKSKAWRQVRMSEVLNRVFRPVEVGESASLDLVSIRRRCGGLFRRPGILASDYKTQDLHQIEAGDFLISKRQVVHGAWAIVEPKFSGALVSKEYAIFVNRDPGNLDMRFFAWLSQTSRMLRLARVSSTGVHIEKLIFDPDVFLREQIRIPSGTAEQAAIAATLDTAETELRLLRQQRTALDQQKRGLMQRLLTGKVRVAA